MKNLISVYTQSQALPGIHLFCEKDPLREYFSSIYIQYGKAIEQELAKPQMIEFEGRSYRTMYAYASNAHILAKIDLQNYFDIALLIETFETEFELTDVRLCISPDAWKKLIKASYLKLVHFDEKFYFQIYDAKLNMKETVLINVQSSQFTSDGFIKNGIRYDDVFLAKNEEKSAGVIYGAGHLHSLSTAFNEKDINLHFRIQDSRKCTSVFVIKDSVCTGELLICPFVGENYS